MRILFFLAFALSLTTAFAQTICIDPGHPSEVGIGTRGKHVTEVHAAWEVALKLRDILREKGYTVVMTKDAELEKVTNKRRAEIANDAGADLAIRLHCDAGSRPGLASYYPAKQGTAADGTTGPTREVMEASSKAAHIFHPAVIAALKGEISDRGLLTDSETSVGGRQGGALTGSIFSTVPVILIEMAVLQNAHDDLFMSQPRGQEIMAEALAAGIEAVVPKK